VSDEPCRILICDDQKDFRTLVSVLLELERDFDVVGEAGDGKRAIELAGELRPDIVLLDIAMPVMDGLEALPAIRESSPGSQVVMLTGVAADRVQDRALEGGAAAFIEKGFDVDQLPAQLRRICAKTG
jgi:DNA-binding NarL/FixJ family response regulator